MDNPYRACKDADQDPIFSGPNSHWVKPSPKRQAIWDSWIDYHCKHCPVLELCARDTLGEEHGIWGGMTQFERHLARRRLETAAKKWPAEKRDFFGKEVSDFRRQGWEYSRITHRTGLTKRLATELQQEWEAKAEQRRLEREQEERRRALEASREAEKALGGLVVRPLPDKPGQRDLWVRYRGQIFDATYRAHSEDDRFIRADIRHLQAMPWIPARDCRIYKPVVKKTAKKGARRAYERAA